MIVLIGHVNSRRRLCLSFVLRNETDFKALGLKALCSRSDDLFLTESSVTIFRAGRMAGEIPGDAEMHFLLW